MHDYPLNPVLCRVLRGSYVESVHRGAWALTNSSGELLEGAGELAAPFIARSSIKALQALPLIETGAAERFGYSAPELALTVSSHGAEPCHTEPVAALLERLGLSARDLRCGPQPPMDRWARAELERAGIEPGTLHNNCSGKHTGFLALARHLDQPLEGYLDPDLEAQELVRRSVAEMCGLEVAQLGQTIDGCSAPTFRLPLPALATGLARLANPEGLCAERRGACRRITDAVAAHPHLVAGTRERLCTDLARASEGRLFGKIGAEAVYVVGAVGRDRGLAVKLDDGGGRALSQVVLALLERFDLLEPAAAEALSSWRETRMKNWAGLEVGSLEIAI